MGIIALRGAGPAGICPADDRSNRGECLGILAEAWPRLVLIDQRLPDWHGLELCVEVLHRQPLVKVVLVSEGEAEVPLTALKARLAGCVWRDLPLASWVGLLLYILHGGLAFSRPAIEGFFEPSGSSQKRQPSLTLGLLQIDLGQCQVEYAGRRIQLTPREFALLACLARNQDQIVSFDQLLNEAWKFDADDGTPAQVRLYVARLRRKLKAIAQTPNFILTERGLGYRLHTDALRRSYLRPERFPSSENRTPSTI
jgi:DNA-binding response OmpR family regulator